MSTCGASSVRRWRSILVQPCQSLLLGHKLLDICHTQTRYNRSKQLHSQLSESSKILLHRLTELAPRVLIVKPQHHRKSRHARLWSEGLFMDIPRVAGFAATLWPEDERAQSEFCETMEEYFGAMRDLGVQLFRMIVASLGVMDVERFVPKEPALTRLNHYPPCPDPARTTGLMPHHDANLITILHQSHVGGLQVLKDGRWVAVRPHPNAFAINAGNMLQVISNELCTSALHRAMVNKTEDRYSLAYFVQAPDWEHMAPLAELVDDNHPAKYRPFTWCQYLATQVEHHTSALDHFLLPA